MENAVRLTNQTLRISKRPLLPISFLTVVLFFLLDGINAQPLSVTITTTDCTCNGYSDGTATATVTGGTPPYSIYWADGGYGQEGPNAYGLWAGYYEVYVYDSDGSEYYESFWITEPPPIVIESEITHVSCHGENDGSISVTVSGEEPPFSYSWGTGSTESTITNLTAGYYYLTVTDNNTCPGFGYYLVSQPAELIIQLEELNHEICLGSENGSIEISTNGGVPPITAEWSNGMSGLSIDNLAPATYAVTLTDNNDCTTSASYTIDAGNIVELTLLEIQHNECFGNTNGVISVIASEGNAPYTYIWSNGLTSATISNLPAGDYSVSVTDEDECFTTADYEITEPTDLDVDLVTLNHETCAGESDGSITIAAGGGTTPYIAEWSNGQTGLFITNLDYGYHTVTVTDNFGCQQTETYYVDPGSDVQVTLAEFQNISCHGGANGVLSLDASEGNAPYTYLWSNGMAGSYITGLPAATYTCTVTDDFGCMASDDYTLTQPAPVTTSIEQISENPCFGDTLASLSAIASGGTPPYTGEWSDNSTGLYNTNLAAGTYTISVTDANMCFQTQTAVIVDPPLLSTSVTTTNETSFEANDGTASAVPGGGTPPYTYLWNNGSTTSTITGLPPGSYTVTITDMNSCVVAATDFVQAYGCTIDVMAGVDYMICENDTSMITPVVVGASGNVTYLWSDGTTGEAIQISAGGDYCVTVADESGCQNADCVFITVSNIPPFTCPVTDESVPDANDGAIQCDSLPGNMTYAWSNGATTPSISGLSPGEYCVTITDSIGCNSTQCFNIQPANCASTLSSEVTHVSCYGQASGAIVLHLAGASEPVTYNWSHGDSSSVADQLTAGNYSVTITDAAGCIDQASFTITEPPAISITIDSVTHVSCYGQASGAILLHLAGVTEPVTYSWSNGDTSNLADQLTAGDYSVTITDAAGCVDQASFTITEPPAISITIDSIASAGITGSGLVWITVTGGTPAYNYHWMDPAGAFYNQEDLSGLVLSGYYSLIVTDSAGCTTVLDSVFVEQSVSVSPEASFKSVHIYPVPTNDVLFIEIENPIEEVTISDGSGRVCRRVIRPGSNQIDVSDLGPGWYVLRVFDGREWYVTGIVK